MSSEFVVASSFVSDRRTPLRYVWSHIRRHPLLIVGLLVGATSNAFFAAFLFFLVGRAYDAMLRAGELGVETSLAIVLQMALGIALSQAVRSVLQFTRNFSSELYGQRIERDARQELYQDLLGKSMTFHDRQPLGELLARVTNDVRELNLMMNPGINLIVGSGIFLVMPAIYSAFLHPLLTIVPVLFIVSYVYAQIRYVRALRGTARRVRSSFGQLNSHLAESLEGIEVVKGNSQERREYERFEQNVAAVYQRNVEQADLEAVYIPFLLLGVATVSGLAHVTYLVIHDVVPISAVVTYMGYFALFGFPVFVSQFSFAQLALGFASANRVLSILNEKTDLDQNIDGVKQPVRGKIEFQRVSFGYNEDANVVNEVSFGVLPGQTVAIVGQTGAGKTTLTKLVNRIYDVQHGQVLIDDVNVKDWNLESLRSQISIIEQDIFLFSRSVEQNIAFSRETYTREEVIQAAKFAQAHDFIMELPEGYDTVIGQRGITLSGGQRQRIAIARAFLSNPRILILDDSTSAIDSATEDKIQQAIWAVAKGRTTLLITHRLSQIRWADHIVVVKKGRVVAQGTHEQLLQDSQVYRNIFAHYEN